jgi:hypothetical protein
MGVPFKPGQSGNLKGRPRKTVDVREILKSVQYLGDDGVMHTGFDPIRQLAIIGATARSEKVRREACADLAPFLAPKLKSIEHTGDNKAPLSINLILSNDS